MDIATVAGLGLAIAAIMGSIMSGGSITIFIDVPSMLVVGGGVIAGTMIKWPMEQLKMLVSVAMKTIFFVIL